MKITRGPYGSTPIDDLSGLMPSHIKTKEELDLWESENITEAYLNYFSKPEKTRLVPESIKKIHKDMFGSTWTWAGDFRKVNLNIGVEWHSIPVEVKKLTDDISYWSSNKHLSVFEQSIRVHHRLAVIHPFKNGNGRHARFVSDLILFNYGEKLPSWPDDKLIESTDVRKRYINALKDADKGNYCSLEVFTQGLIKGVSN